MSDSIVPCKANIFSLLISDKETAPDSRAAAGEQEEEKTFNQQRKRFGESRQSLSLSFMKRAGFYVYAENLESSDVCRVY